MSAPTGSRSRARAASSSLRGCALPPPSLSLFAPPHVPTPPPGTSTPRARAEQPPPLPDHQRVLPTDGDLAPGGRVRARQGLQVGQGPAGGIGGGGGRGAVREAGGGTVQRWTICCRTMIGINEGCTLEALLRGLEGRVGALVEPRTFACVRFPVTALGISARSSCSSDEATAPGVCRCVRERAGGHFRLGSREGSTSLVSSTSSPSSCSSHAQFSPYLLQLQRAPPPPPSSSSPRARLRAPQLVALIAAAVAAGEHRRSPSPSRQRAKPDPPSCTSHTPPAPPPPAREALLALLLPHLTLPRRRLTRSRAPLLVVGPRPRSRRRRRQQPVPVPAGQRPLAV